MDIEFVMYLFNDYLGGADSDELSAKFMNFDLNDPVTRKNFIENDLKSAYSHFDDYQREIFLTSVDELINKRLDISREVNGSLLPFDFPDDVVSFFQEILSVCVESQDQSLNDRSSSQVPPTAVSSDHDVTPGKASSLLCLVWMRDWGLRWASRSFMPTKSIMV